MTSESAGPFVDSSPTHPTTDSSNVASAIDQQHRLSLRKARKLSRVFTEFSLLDPFASRKNVDNNLQTPPYTAGNTGHTYTQTRSKSLDASSKKKLDEQPSLSTSSISQSPSREIKTDTTPQDNELMQISETVEELPQLLAPSIPQIRSPRPPEISPPSSSSYSSRYTSVPARKQRKSLVLRKRGGSQLLTRSSSLGISDMRRPLTHKRRQDSSPDIRELPALPEAYNHYLEVKRARKMTQLFGRELPSELIRVPDTRRQTEFSQHRRESSSSLESVLSMPETNNKTSFLEEDVSSPELPRAEFQERRRRVTKLTQFFGVSHSEIASSVVNAKPDDRTTFSLDVESPKYASAAIIEHEVGVKIVSRRRWGLGEDMRDVELSDAITRLRGLKST